jgi:hypothetical protein
VVSPRQIRLNRTHLGVGILRPEPADDTAVGVGWEDVWPGKGLIDVLQDNEQLVDGAAVMEEHGHLPVHGVGCQQQLALAT